MADVWTLSRSLAISRYRHLHSIYDLSPGIQVRFVVRVYFASSLGRFAVDLERREPACPSHHAYHNDDDYVAAVYRRVNPSIIAMFVLLGHPTSTSEMCDVKHGKMCSIEEEAGLTFAHKADPKL
jgi:hypothetical protein